MVGELPLLQGAWVCCGGEPAPLCEGGCDGELPLLSVGLSENCPCGDAGGVRVEDGAYRSAGDARVEDSPRGGGGARVEPVLSGMPWLGTAPWAGSSWGHGQSWGCRLHVGLALAQGRAGSRGAPKTALGLHPIIPRPRGQSPDPRPEVGPEGEFGGGLMHSWTAGQGSPHGRGHSAEEGRGTSGRQLDGRQPAVYRRDTSWHTAVEGRGTSEDSQLGRLEAYLGAAGCGG